MADPLRTIQGRTWAFVMVSLLVGLSVVYLGWASSYISARLVIIDPLQADIPVDESAPRTVE